MTDSAWFAVGVIVTAIAALLIHVTVFYNVPVNQWQCTAARVVNETLPKVEECVQYSRKDAPHAQ